MMLVEKRIVKKIVSKIHPCQQCRTYRDFNELMLNFGLCDDCFEMNCPCNDNHANACPLHRYPDVVLSFSNERG